MNKLVIVIVPANALRSSPGGPGPLPSSLRTGAGLVQHETHIHVEHAHRMLSALKIAAHPIKTVCYARKHMSLKCVSRLKPRYLYYPRPATSSPPASPFATPRG